jgi:hypothetical protein
MNLTICKHLRTKKMYVEATVEEALAEKSGAEASPCHYWCNRTQTVAGPDDRPVHKAACGPARSCYQE